MSDENTGTEESQANEGGAQADEVVSKSEFTKVIGQRQEFKAKAREYEAKIAEYEAKEREREEEDMRKRGEYEELLKAEQEEKSRVLQELDQLKWGQRFKNTVDAVSTKAGIDPVLVESLLLREKQVSGADVALEEVTDDAVVALAKRLRSAAPSLFQTEGKGGSPGAPGLNPANKKPGEGSGRGKYYALAQQVSAHNKRTD